MRRLWAGCGAFWWCCVVAGSAAAQTAATPISPAAPPPAPSGPKLGGYLQVRETFADATRLSATLNRARFSIDGPLPNRFTYRFLVELESGATARATGTVSLREAFVRWTYAPIAFQAGQFKTPFSREFLTPVPALETPDFSAIVDTLAPKYDIGLMGEVGVPLVGLSLGVFNGEGQNIGLNRDSTVLAVGRLTLRPVAQATFGGHVARYSPDSTRYGADVSLEQGGLFARGELLGQRKRGRSRDDQGWYVLATVRIWPWLQVLGKQEDFQRPALGVARRISATTGGFNLELPGGRTRLLGVLVGRTTGFPRVKRNGVITQLQVRF